MLRSYLGTWTLRVSKFLRDGPTPSLGHPVLFVKTHGVQFFMGLGGGFRYSGLSALQSLLKQGFRV